MYNTATAPEFAEGTLDFASGVWFCMDHSASVPRGRDCAWCMSEVLTPAEFEAWLADHG